MKETLFVWMNTFCGWAVTIQLEYQSQAWNFGKFSGISPTSTGRIFVATYPFAKFLVPIVASSS